jgi:hypothetical protein
MQSFTGPEIAALLEEGCIIASGHPFSEELQRQIQQMPIFMHSSTAYHHWIAGVYLITGVKEDERQIAWHVEDEELLLLSRQRLGDSLGMWYRGKRLNLAAAGALAGIAPGDLREAFANLHAPCTLVLEKGEANCGDDHITAVNLTRPIPAPKPALVAQAIERVAQAFPKAAPQKVELTHFIGGPCDEDEVVTCIVLGGTGRGWTVVEKLEDSIKLATSRAFRRHPAQGDVSGGQTVRLQGLKARPDLNGELGVALKFSVDSGRWLVRLRNGDGKHVKPANLFGLQGAHGRVYVFWGDARWSRAQLLGEIARGHWGLCRASVADVTVEVRARRQEVDSRLVFAPVTEMTEDFLREMNFAHAGAMVVRAEQREADEEEDGIGRDRSESLLSDAGTMEDAAAAAAAATAAVRDATTSSSSASSPPRAPPADDSALRGARATNADDAPAITADDAPAMEDAENGATGAAHSEGVSLGGGAGADGGAVSASESVGEQAGARAGVGGHTATFIRPFCVWRVFI